MVDLTIKIREIELGTWRPGYLTGYPFRGEDQEETYMGISIGRYTERANSTHLPKFGSRILIKEDMWVIVLEGDAVAAVRQEIRDYKKSKR